MHVRCSGNQLNLEGDGAYDAAVHCAAVWAETRGGDVPANVIDTSNPETLQSARSLPAGFGAPGQEPRTGEGEIGRIPAYRGGPIDADSQTSGSKVRLAGILRTFGKKISGITQRPFDLLRPTAAPASPIRRTQSGL